MNTVNNSKRTTIDLFSSLGGANSFSGRQSVATRRQQKHEMLVAFIANAKKPQPKPAPGKPKLLKALLSFFF